MTLTDQQLRDKLTGEAPKATKTAAAVSQELRLRLHSLSPLSVSDPQRKELASAATTKYLEWVKGLLPRDKYKRFAQLLRAPYPTAALTAEIYDALEKCFDGRDPVEEYRFTSDDLTADWLDYRDNELGGRDAWRSKGMATLRQRPNGVCIVDLREQEGSRPEPYWYVADLSTVFDMKLKPNSDELEYLILESDEDGEKVAYAFDAERYRKLVQTNGIWSIVSDEPHDLGYCPARLFWTESVTPFDRLVKQTPLSVYLAALDKLLFAEISKDYLELYARYPIVTTYEEDCTFADADTFCEDGILRMTANNSVVLSSDLSPAPCPACGDNRLVGPGTVISVPAPSSATEGKDLAANAVQIIGIDRPSLDYNVEENERKRREIYEGAVGSSLEAINDQAINERQVNSLFEARRAVLMRVKKNFEAVQKWAESTICRLRYGSSFLGMSVNFGTEFFLFTASEILDAYEQARAKGLDHAVLDYLQEQYFQTLHRESPKRLQRSMMLLDLDPARHLTGVQAFALFEAGLLTREDYAVKVNMSTYIDRFERDNVPLTEFGIALEYRERIERIKAALYTYVPQGEQANEEESTSDKTDQSAALKAMVETYGVAVRAGVITPQVEDENRFRAAIGLPPMSSDAAEAWREGGGIRRPITLKTESELQDARPGNINQPEPAPTK